MYNNTANVYARKIDLLENRKKKWLARKEISSEELEEIRRVFHYVNKYTMLRLLINVSCRLCVEQLPVNFTLADVIQSLNMESEKNQLEEYHRPFNLIELYFAYVCAYSISI